MTSSTYPPAVGPTRLVLRMADMLTAQGAAYPMAGALSSAVRGRQNLNRSEYAQELGLTLGQVEAAECGRTPLRQLPKQLLERIPWLGLDLTALPTDPAPKDSPPLSTLR